VAAPGTTTGHKDDERRLEKKENVMHTSDTRKTANMARKLRVRTSVKAGTDLPGTRPVILPKNPDGSDKPVLTVDPHNW
jgi:hypothetical protein